MNREVNTLDSKISDAEIRWLAVDAKAAIERDSRTDTESE